MKKTTEERLANIESSIARLTKMQDRAFKALLILHTKLSTVSIKSTNQDMDHFPVAFLGILIAFAGIAGSTLSLYFVTQVIGFKVFAILFGILGIGFAIIYYGQYRSANRQLRETKKIMSPLEDALVRILAEWEELVPDDLVSEPKSED